MPKIVEVLPDQESLIQRSLTLVMTKLQAALEARGRCTIALSGGSTPEPLYAKLATQALPWDKVQVFWGDERYVPSDHPDSNARMAREVWLDRVPLPPANLHPLPTDGGDPAADAQRYEEHIRDYFHTQPGEFPVLDVVLLGMGDDGHTASLFPHTKALQVCDRLITVGEKDGQPRLTFTVPLINQADCVIFIVAGASKRPALAQVFAPIADHESYPSRLIHPQGELYWLLDAAAGLELNQT